MIVYFIYIALFLATILWMSLQKPITRSVDAEYIRLPRYQSESELSATIVKDHLDFWARLKRVLVRLGSLVIFVMGCHYFLMIFV